MRKWMLTFGAMVAVVGGLPRLGLAQTPEPKLFYPTSDPSLDIAAAIAKAKIDRRHVLLDFGADWCPDCRVLGTLFDDPAVAPVLGENFHVVRIDVGHRDRNATLVDRYGATSGEWIPAVVVLDGDGRRVAGTDSTVRLTRRTTTAELTARLREWAPKSRWHELASFTESGIRVTVALDRDTTGGWWLAAAFVPVVDAAHLYSKDLPAAGIDGLGRPTTFSLSAASGVRVVGDVIADRTTVRDVVEILGTVLPIYPPGPVTLRLPVTFSDPTAATRVEAMVGYMACTPQGCLRPVTNKRVPFTIPPVVVRRAAR